MLTASLLDDLYSCTGLNIPMYYKFIMVSKQNVSLFVVNITVSPDLEMDPNSMFAC